MQNKIVTLGDVLEEIIDKIKPHADSYFDTIKNNWYSIVGEEIAKNTDPVKIENSILIVKVSSHIWKNELKGGLGFTILKKIQENYSKKISKIRWI